MAAQNDEEPSEFEIPVDEISADFALPDPDAGHRKGPLHLQNNLTDPNPILIRSLEKAISHPLSLIKGIYDKPRDTSLKRMLLERIKSEDPKVRETALRRLNALQKHQDKRISYQSSANLPAYRKKNTPTGGFKKVNEEDGREEQLAPIFQAARENAAQSPVSEHEGEGGLDLARQFLIELNEEAGVVRAFSILTGKMLILYDRQLYAGIRPETMSPAETYPYRSMSGGYAFEIAMGFDYSDDSFDDNDFMYVCIAVRCIESGEVAVILDEETF